MTIRYDHHNDRLDIERTNQQRRGERAAYRDAIRRDLPDAEAMPSDGRWQGRFLFRVCFQFAFWTWLLFWLAGSPTILIRWLQ